MKWKPWEDYSQELELLPIKDPPCNCCHFWRPQREYNENGYSGIRCCTNDEMCNDFSCYKEKELLKNDNE